MPIIARNYAASLTLCLFCASAAQAHLMPQAQGTLNLRGPDAYAMVSLPAGAFRNADDDNDGTISARELARHHDDLLRQANAGFQVLDGARPGMTEAILMLPDGTADSPYLVMMQHTHFPAPPRAPLLAATLFGPDGAARQLAIRVSNATQAELVILTPDVPERALFLGFFGSLANFIKTGMLHILTGPDHLLFLLTVVSGARGWRYWASVVTAFTIAHSITLTLAAENIMRVPSFVTEPAIAASIVVMALANLWRQADGGQALALRARIGLVFACGLLHGMGFASALGDMALDGAHRIASLIGFNLGVEAGQAVFLAGLGCLALAWSALARKPALLLRSRTFPAVAAALGLVMFVQRVSGR